MQDYNGRFLGMWRSHKLFWDTISCQSWSVCPPEARSSNPPPPVLLGRETGWGHPVCTADGVRCPVTCVAMSKLQDSAALAEDRTGKANLMSRKPNEVDNT